LTSSAHMLTNHIDRVNIAVVREGSHRILWAERLSAPKKNLTTSNSPMPQLSCPCSTPSLSHAFPLESSKYRKSPFL
jgi:hypothetical protein